jgi:hypothetical protein
MKNSSTAEFSLAERGLLALQTAVDKLAAERARDGLPMYIWRDGQVVALSPEELRSLSKP